MAVAPPASMGMVSSTPPGIWSGNMDLKELRSGTTLYLPVFNPGAQFYVGDGCGVQGDDEVDGGALETSLAPMLQFFLHKGKATKTPWAESAAHFILMGMSIDLNEAAALVVKEAVSFLERRKRLSAAEAYAFASLGVDLRIAKAVDVVSLVYAMIPKKFFKDERDNRRKP
jgi:acetamidase/formamidase